MRILIVDDSALMRRMLRRIFSLVDMPIEEIFEAGNGVEALNVLQRHEIDVLLTDINMPVMTGIELLREIAHKQRWRDMRRVVISTDGTAARRDEAAGLDVRCYLEKPFSPDVVREVLNGVV